MGGYLVDGDTERIVTLVRQAKELGADIIKADPTDDVGDYRKVIEVAGDVPVLVRGGGRSMTEPSLERTRRGSRSRSQRNRLRPKRSSSTRSPRGSLPRSWPCCTTEVSVDGALRSSREVPHDCQDGEHRDHRCRPDGARDRRGDPRWPALIDHTVRPRLTAVCDINPAALDWFDGIDAVHVQSDGLPRAPARPDDRCRSTWPFGMTSTSGSTRCDRGG